MAGKDRIIVALDFPTKIEAVNMARRLRTHVGGFKIGKQICTAEGAPQMALAIGEEETFLDLKFHDTPNTVKGAAEAAAMLRVKMFNVHCSGGPDMLLAARAGTDKGNVKTGHRSLVLGVTILTSMDKRQLGMVGMTDEPIAQHVIHLARLAYDCLLDGVVCPPAYVPMILGSLPSGRKFLFDTPGIRDEFDPPDDQKLTMTASGAVEAGSDYLVIGRPITGAPDPVAAADKIAAGIDAAERSVV